MLNVFFMRTKKNAQFLKLNKLLTYLDFGCDLSAHSNALLSTVFTFKKTEKKLELKRHV